MIDIFKFATSYMTRHLAAAAARCRVMSILKIFQKMFGLNEGQEMRGRNGEYAAGFEEGFVFPGRSHHLQGVCGFEPVVEIF